MISCQQRTVIISRSSQDLICRVFRFHYLSLSTSTECRYVSKWTTCQSSHVAALELLLLSTLFFMSAVQNTQVVVITSPLPPTCLAPVLGSSNLALSKTSAMSVRPFPRQTAGNLCAFLSRIPFSPCPSVFWFLTPSVIRKYYCCLSIDLCI